MFDEADILDQDSAFADADISAQNSLPTSGLPPNDTTPKATAPKAEVSNSVGISVPIASYTNTGDQFSVAIS